MGDSPCDVCSCIIPDGQSVGWCERHGCKKTRRWGELCRTRPDYFRAWEEGRGPGQKPVAGGKEAWTPDSPSRGLGDTIAKLTHVTGIDRVVKAVSRLVDLKDCGCAKRQQLLNRMFPYRRTEPVFGRIDPYTWITTDRLVTDAIRLAAHLPRDIDAIVGVARSGLIPAAAIATWLHARLFSVNVSSIHPASDILELGGGYRVRTTEWPQEVRRVLIVDDTCQFGHSIRPVAKGVCRSFPGATIESAVIYGSGSAFRLVDYVAWRLDGGHWLEWNFFNSDHLKSVMTDLDGILCDDCPPDADDDGERYAAWLRSVRPFHTPRRHPVPVIITARLEKYREPTAAWLADHGVRCEHLVMGPWKTLAERYAERGLVARWKASVYRQSPLRLFVESDPEQAKLIRRIAGKPVLCPKLGRLLP